MTDETEECTLTGGNMNTPVLRENMVYRKNSDYSNSIRALLNHLRNKCITWVPRFLGIDDRNREMPSYIDGDVPHKKPDWLYKESVLIDTAAHMRIFHDTTVDFRISDYAWQLPSSNPVEVICHNDFAPYNCVFHQCRFNGLIDFDLCSPGSRLWDIAYCVYRFVHFMPDVKEKKTDERSHYNRSEIIRRAEIFLKSYAGP